MPGPVQDAWQRDLPLCPKCHAWRGDPCRTPLNKPTRAHRERERYKAEEVAVRERNEGKVENETD